MRFLRVIGQWLWMHTPTAKNLLVGSVVEGRAIRYSELRRWREAVRNVALQSHYDRSFNV